MTIDARVVIPIIVTRARWRQAKLATVALREIRSGQTRHVVAVDRQASAAGWEQVGRSRSRLGEYRAAVIRRGLRGSALEGRVQYSNGARPLLLELEFPLKRGHDLGKFGDVAQILNWRLHLLFPDKVPGSLDTDKLPQANITYLGRESGELREFLLQRVVERFVLLHELGELLVHLLSVRFELQMPFVVETPLCSLFQR